MILRSKANNVWSQTAIWFPHITAFSTSQWKTCWTLRGNLPLINQSVISCKMPFGRQNRSKKETTNCSKNLRPHNPTCWCGIPKEKIYIYIYISFELLFQPGLRQWAAHLTLFAAWPAVGSGLASWHSCLQRGRGRVKPFLPILWRNSWLEWVGRYFSLGLKYGLKKNHQIIEI